MTVEEYREYKEDWNIPLTEDMEEIERKQKVTRATLAVAEAVYKAIDNLEEDERKPSSKIQSQRQLRKKMTMKCQRLKALKPKSPKKRNMATTRMSFSLTMNTQSYRRNILTLMKSFGF